MTTLNLAWSWRLDFPTISIQLNAPLIGILYERYFWKLSLLEIDHFMFKWVDWDSIEPTLCLNVFHLSWQPWNKSSVKFDWKDKEWLAFDQPFHLEHLNSFTLNQYRCSWQSCDPKLHFNISKRFNRLSLLNSHA